MPANPNPFTVTFPATAVNPAISITLFEQLTGTHDTHIWPSSLVLSAYLLTRPDLLLTARVLELGCGTGLPGLLSATLGAPLTILSDRPNSAAIQSLIPLAITSNNLHQTCAPKPLQWGHFAEEDILPSPTTPIPPPSHGGPGWLSTPFTLLLGADVFYNPPDFDPLLATVSYILRRSPPTARFLTAYHQRSSTRSIQYLLDKWKLKCCLVPRELYVDLLEEVEVNGKKVVDDGEGAFENVDSVVLLEIYNS
ncbi:hypothetical protein HDV00_000833 [Rhizophlyctis rosea]|nr:hypothetical protein HDV00_000833 [Rhizophlyctis rosea]